MLSIPKVTLSLTLALAAAPALAQEAPKPTPPYSPEITQTDDTTKPNVKVNVQPTTPAPTVNVQTPSQPPTVNVQTPAQPPTVNVQPAPAPSTVVVPPPAQAAQPVVVDQRPVNVTVVQPEIGMAISLGGGVGQFTDSAIRDRTSPNGEYEARLLFGTHSPLAAEAAYVGTAGTIDALGQNDSAVLISNGVEGLGRLNFMDAPIQPFVVGGMSWVRYNVVNRKASMSDVRNQDDVLVVPVGAGLATYLPDTGFMADIRFMYHFTFDDELLRPTVQNTTGASLANWNVSLRLGYAF